LHDACDLCVLCSTDTLDYLDYWMPGRQASDATLTHVITFNLIFFVFSNYYRCLCVGVLSSFIAFVFQKVNDRCLFEILKKLNLILCLCVDLRNIWIRYVFCGTSFIVLWGNRNECWTWRDALWFLTNMHMTCVLCRTQTLDYWMHVRHVAHATLTVCNAFFLGIFWFAALLYAFC